MAPKVADCNRPPSVQMALRSAAGTKKLADSMLAKVIGSAAACVGGFCGLVLLSSASDGMVRAQSIIVHPPTTCREASRFKLAPTAAMDDKQTLPLAAWREGLLGYVSTVAVKKPPADKFTSTSNRNAAEVGAVNTERKEYNDLSSVKCPYSAAMYVGTKLSTRCPAWMHHKEY